MEQEPKEEDAAYVALNYAYWRPPVMRMNMAFRNNHNACFQSLEKSGAD